jgi:tRNA(Ile)-lysidine synthase
VEQLSELARSAGGFYSLVCSCADKVWPEPADCTGEKITLDLKMFLAQSQPVRVELIRRSLTAIGSGERDLTQHHYEMILQLAEQDVGGRKIELPGAFVVGSEYGKLIFTRPQKSEKRSQKTEVRNLSSVVLEVPGQMKFGRYSIQASTHSANQARIEEFKAAKNGFTEWFDLDKLKLPLVVRFREAGDRFWPLGLAAEKKIGKFLTAAKVPYRVRRKLLVVADIEKIIWVWPVRMSEQAKVNGETRKIVQLQITGAPIQAE